jgi:transcriptional regulator with XRE-family HTH domain
VGVDRTYISALERGVYNASVGMIEKLAKVLKVEPRYESVPQRRVGENCLERQDYQ